jgi:hypothetical protein
METVIIIALRLVGINPTGLECCDMEGGSA